MFLAHHGNSLPLDGVNWSGADCLRIVLLRGTGIEVILNHCVEGSQYALNCFQSELLIAAESKFHVIGDSMFPIFKLDHTVLSLYLLNSIVSLWYVPDLQRRCRFKHFGGCRERRLYTRNIDGGCNVGSMCKIGICILIFIHH